MSLHLPHRHRLSSPLFRLVGVVAFGSGLATAQPAATDDQLAAHPSKVAWRALVDERLRQQIVASNVAKPRDPDLSPVLVHAGADPDIVTLSPFRVNGARMEAELQRRYLRADKKAHEDAVMRRVGVGFHGVKLGGITAGVATVFFVPVQATVSWDW